MAFIFLNATCEAQEPPSIADLAGTWIGTLSHEGANRPISLSFEAGEHGEIAAKMSLPTIHVLEYPIGPASLDREGVRILKTVLLTYDPSAKTLTGVIPPALVPVYKLAVTFRKGTLERSERQPLDAPVATPVWTFDAGGPIWADTAFGHGVVYAATDEGRLHALSADTGKPLWSFRAGGAIRGRPVLSGGDIFVQADDGWLYKLRLSDGGQIWRVRVDEKPVERLPFDNPKSRFERGASAVAVVEDRLYLGTFGGHLLSLDRGTGERVWDFAAGNTILSTPLVTGGHVYFGSFDGNIYALDARTGTLLWKHDTGAAVVSTPALHEGHVIVGSRSYDLLSLDAATGAPFWTRYIWFSWVESPVAVAADSLYVGSSDAAKVFALDPRTGRSKWELDVWGWPWGEPAVSDTRVYIGTGGDRGYGEHRGGFIAVDRGTGRPAWRFEAPRPASSGPTYGFPASAALGDGRVYVGGLDGRVYAFAQ